MRGFALLGITTLAALALSGVASSVVKRVSVTSPVTTGERATLTVNVTPRGRCTATVASKPRAQLLPAKTGARITWRWTIDPSTNAGRWPVVVNCGASGRLRTAMAVKAAGPELALLDATKVICYRTPGRVSRRFPQLAVRLVPNGLPFEVGAASSGPYYRCGFFVEAASGTRPASYSVTITRTARCTYTAQGRADPSSDNKDYGALGETYTETCASLR